MNLPFILFTGFSIGISGAMIPGPLTLFTISAVLKSNKFAGLKIILGHIIIEFVIIAAILLGFHSLFVYREFILAVSIIGGLALIAMGMLLLLKVNKLRLSDINTDLSFDRGLILGGIFFSIVSPGFVVWWATIGFSTIIQASLLGTIGVITITAGHWLADVLWYGSVSYALDKGKMYLNDRSYQKIMRFFSFILIILGLYFIIFKR